MTDSNSPQIIKPKNQHRQYLSLVAEAARHFRVAGSDEQRSRASVQINKNGENEPGSIYQTEFLEYCRDKNIVLHTGSDEPLVTAQGLNSARTRAMNGFLTNLESVGMSEADIKKTMSDLYLKLVKFEQLDEFLADGNTKQGLIDWLNNI